MTQPPNWSANCRDAPFMTVVSTWRRLLSSVAAAAAIAALGACDTGSPSSSTSPSSSDSTQHLDGKGPLSASSGPGGFAMQEPGTTPWAGSFGGFVLCRNDPTVKSIVLTGVRLAIDVEPKAVATWLRQTSPHLPPEQRKLAAPFSSTWGSPPRFKEPYVRGRYPGRFTNRIEGVTVTASCQETQTATRRLFNGERPRVPLQELIVSMESGSSGAQISEAYVDYEADGQPRTLRIRWSMALCGTAISQENCPPS